MESQIVDQTESEVKLHRILYLIQFLRAGVLVLFIHLTAVTLALTVDVSGIFAFSDAWLQPLMKLISAFDRWPFTPGFVVVIGTSTLVVLVWMYLAITRVWRTALELQAALHVLTLVMSAIWMFPVLVFSWEHLALTFSGLLAIYFLISVVFIVDVAVALSEVARVPEPSAFRATLDRRLCPNIWVFFNRLVDLPRTPWRNRRVLASYLFAFVGKVWYLSCIMYLLGVGLVSSKAAEFLFLQSEYSSEELRRQSADWATQTTIWLVLSLAGLKSALALESLAKKIGALSVDELFAKKRGTRRFTLYLRSFAMDPVVLPKPKLSLLSRLVSFQPFRIRIEEQLFDVADGYQPLIAIANPRARALTVRDSAYRAEIRDENWQQYVADRIREAENIVVVLRDTEGVLWEYATILDSGAEIIGKTLFFFDPAAKDPEAWQALAEKVVVKLKAAGVVSPHFSFQRRPLAFIVKDGSVVEIQNDNWSSTSYRTAFSFFLSQRTQ